MLGLQGLTHSRASQAVVRGRGRYIPLSMGIPGEGVLHWRFHKLDFHVIYFNNFLCQLVP